MFFFGKGAKVEGKGKLETILLDRLIAHPGNPNRMSAGAFGKLKSHIERTGRYEPLVVRPHSGQEGCFEIINGHHRAGALRQLGRDRADCVVWDVDNDEALVLLATLNRLGGRDDVHRKSELIQQLAGRYDTKRLASMLPDTSRTIERLKDLQKRQPYKPTDEVLLHSLVFFLTGDQKRTVEEAIAKATDDESAGTRSQKCNRAIVKIAKAFLA